MLRLIFAANTRNLRHLKNMSQEDLADLSGLHRTYISSVERGERNISIDNIEKISIALKVNPYTLLVENYDF